MAEHEIQLERRKDADWKLIRGYVDGGSQGAFDELARRYVKLVYSVCFRETRSAALAEDASQAVFIVFARKIASFRRPVVMSSWLFEVCRMVCRNVLRAERRRLARERGAMEAEPGGTATIGEVELLLNDAIARLSATDRDAVVLRFVDELTFPEMGQALGISEDAARVRVNRAVDRLRSHMKRSGSDVVVTVIAAAMTAKAVDAAVVERVVASVGAGGKSAAVICAEGVIKTMLLKKLAIGLSIGAVCLMGASYVAVGARALINHRVLKPSMGQDTASQSPTNSAKPGSVLLRFKFIKGQTDVYKIGFQAGAILTAHGQTERNAAGDALAEFKATRRIADVDASGGAIVDYTFVPIRLKSVARDVFPKSAKMTVSPTGVEVDNDPKGKANDTSLSTNGAGFNQLDTFIPLPAKPMAVNEGWESDDNVVYIVAQKRKVHGHTVVDIRASYNGPAKDAPSQGTEVLVGAIEFDVDAGQIIRADGKQTFFSETTGQDGKLTVPVKMDTEFSYHLALVDTPVTQSTPPRTTEARGASR